MAKNTGKKMPVSGKVITGSATGQPKSESKIKFGNDLRSGKGK